MNKLKYTGIVLMTTVAFIIMLMAFAIPIKFPKNAQPSFDFGFVQMLCFLAVFIISMFIAIRFEKVKNIGNKILLTILLSSIFSGVFLSNFSDTDYFNNLKISYNLGVLSEFEEKYPNSTDAEELKNLIKNREYRAVQNFDNDKLKYIEQLDASLLATRYQTPEINKIFKNIMEDGLISEKEKNDLALAVKNHLVAKLKT